MTTLPRTAARTVTSERAGAYVYAYFTETPDRSGANYGLHLAVSRDGRDWAPLNQNQPVTTPTAGRRGLRDPFLHRRRDGTFVVAATDLTGPELGLNSQHLHIWDSTDLVSFTGYRHVRLHTMDTRTWAPTVFWDTGHDRYGIAYSADNGTRDVLMVNYTRDFRTVSAPQVLFDPGPPVLLGGPGPGRGDDGGRTLANQRDCTPPLNAGHGSIAAVTTAEYHTLVGRWGLPDWVRLKSWNAPDRYVRHYHGAVRLDAYPFDPYRDQLWRLVPGLADPAGVSFASINRPGCYLRHRGRAVRLDPDDGSPAFPADATFHRVAGLAGTGWTSLCAINLPGHYLRHSGYVLRLDPFTAASSAADREDATFRITS